MSFLRKNFLIILSVLIGIVTVYSAISSEADKKNVVSYTSFAAQLEQNSISKVQVDYPVIKFTNKSNIEQKTVLPLRDDNLLKTLLEKGVQVEGTFPDNPTFLGSVFRALLPFILMFAFLILSMRFMAGGVSNKAMGIGKSPAKLLSQDQLKVRLSDVAGSDEAKAEVAEVIDFLRDPMKFNKIGATIPKGVLMVGPPGTGKTLLAKAIAGEASVPFFSISGSDFVEMFVGVGASRVRALFEQAKKVAPCIIFIDEIDAVGRKRGSGMGGGNDEREQTLNQMLIEMDGFEENSGVIVIAATNRDDVLDEALTRPGRFDRKVNVSLPDLKGREQILKVHTAKVALDKEVNLKTIAKTTSGFSGAGLANLVNEAALMSARENRSSITQDMFQLAFEKILMGSERKTLTMTNEEKERTAYHESGHVIVGYLQEDKEQVHKATILPRGRALGFALSLPVGDIVSYTYTDYISKIRMLFAGRVCEELKYGKEKVSSGASNDIMQATRIARAMVTQYGFSDDLGPVEYTYDEYGRVHNGPEFLNKIDKEIRSLFDKLYEETKILIMKNMDILEAMKNALLEFETIDRKQIERLMAREDAGLPVSWSERERTTSSS